MILGFSRTTQASKIDGACLRGRSSQPPHCPLLPCQWQRRRPFVVLPPSSSSCLLRRGKARVAPTPLMLQQSSHHIKLCAACSQSHICDRFEIFNIWKIFSCQLHTVHIIHLFTPRTPPCQMTLVQNKVRSGLL